MKKYTKKQIVEAIAYWKNQLKKMNESVRSNNFHRLQSYTDLENKETASCALMMKVVNNKKYFRWVPYDEIYDMFFEKDWILYPDISSNEYAKQRQDVIKIIDDIYNI